VRSPVVLVAVWVAVVVGVFLTVGANVRDAQQTVRPPEPLVLPAGVVPPPGCRLLEGASDIVCGRRVLGPWVQAEVELDVSG